MHHSNMPSHYIMALAQRVIRHNALPMDPLLWETVSQRCQRELTAQQVTFFQEESTLVVKGKEIDEDTEVILKHELEKHILSSSG